MRVRDLCLGLGSLAGLLTGACQDRSTERAATAPDVPLTASIASRGTEHVSHFTSKGWFGDFWFNADVNGEAYESGYLGVYQGGTRKDRQVFLYYEITQCDYLSSVCTSVESGNGSIPPGDVVQQGETLTLHTDTAANPDFSIFAGPGGPITISWTQTAGFSVEENRNSRASYLSGLKVRFHETRSRFSALAQGSMLGRVLNTEATYASMGTVHSGEIDIEKNVKIEP